MVQLKIQHLLSILFHKLFLFPGITKEIVKTNLENLFLLGITHLILQIIMCLKYLNLSIIDFFGYYLFMENNHDFLKSINFFIQLYQIIHQN